MTITTGTLQIVVNHTMRIITSRQQQQLKQIGFKIFGVVLFHPRPLATTAAELIQCRSSSNGSSNANGNANNTIDSTNGSTTRISRKIHPSSSRVVPKNVREYHSSETAPIGNIVDYFHDFRRKAAQTVVSALPKNEQQLLLDKLQLGGGEGIPKKNTDNNDQDKKPNSIAETIAVTQLQKVETEIQEAKAKAAAAVKEEVEETKMQAKYEKKLELAREKILEEAEIAVRNRMVNDIELQKRKLQFVQWKQQLEKEKEQEREKVTKTRITTEEKAAPINDNDEEVEKQEINETEQDHHPILGKCLYDFGYKRLHLVSSLDLGSIPVWKEQRTYRHARSQIMANDKMKTLQLFGMPGIIGLVENIDGSLHIIDGQHRVGMLQVLEKKMTSTATANDSTDDDDEDNDGSSSDDAVNASSLFDFENILVEVFPAGRMNDTTTSSTKKREGDDNEYEYAKEIFLEVNKAEPVKLIDLPGVGTKSSSGRKIVNRINVVADKLKNTYPHMFSESQRCRLPHVNIDNLRDAIFGSNIVQKHNLNTTKQLEEWILQQNDILGTKYNKNQHDDENKQQQQMVIPVAALNKANKYNFYLGLDSRWLYN